MAGETDKNRKPAAPPPLPPGFFKSQGAQPQAPAFRPPMPQFPQPAAPFQAVPRRPAPQAQENDKSAEDLERAKEEKDKLEKKLLEMERNLAQEKEKVLLANLKNQQDDALSSKVESSLKEIQDKMRRNKRDQEVEEERLSLKGKIKELETRLIQERETWMQTLKSQLQEKESTSKEVESHFIYRLNEIERRWLDEKAQWQKMVNDREEEIRRIRSDSEKAARLEDEVKKLNLEKIYSEKDLYKLREDLARAERERASVESYIKIIPEKEKDLAELRANISVLKMKEEKDRMEFENREAKLLLDIEKYQRELGILQKEMGAFSDRKNAEKEEEIKKLRNDFEYKLQERENKIAELSGEKVRAGSELVKAREFMARMQAVNSAMEKERGQLRGEKMQLAQNLAAAIEENKRMRAEVEDIKKRQEEELQRARDHYAGDVRKEYENRILEINRKHGEEIIAERKKYEEEALSAKERFSNEKSEALSAKSEEFDRKLPELKNKIREEVKAEFSEKISLLEGALAQNSDKFKKYEAEREKAVNDIAVLSAELQKISGEAEVSKNSAAGLKKILEETQRRLSENETLSAKRLAESEALSAEFKKMEENFSALSAKHGELIAALGDAKGRLDEYEKVYSSASAELENSRKNCEALRSEISLRENALSEKERSLAEISSMAAQHKSAREAAEGEMASLKTEISGLSRQLEDTVAAAEKTKNDFQNTIKALSEDLENLRKENAAFSAELERYREASFADRIKWALKGDKKEPS